MQPAPVPADGLADELAPSVGEDRRVYAVGDVHGRLDLLEALLRRIAEDDRARGPMPPTLILLGDLVDRGPASRQIVSLVMALAAEEAGLHCLKGNHEELFLLAAKGDVTAIPTFRKAGGGATLASYGLVPRDFEAMADVEIAAWMLAHVPRDHVDFLDALPDRLIVGDYLFVHAGIRPGVPIDRQSGADMRWIRRAFLEHEGAHPLMVVHGHSITDDVDERANRIGIDTGAYFSGRLTALGLEGSERWVIQTGD
ncbi:MULTISPECIES: metallophosphoesterase family protein [unclassified Sphingobium]|uniref:metallophosphoesterase family protein n=1 Tax=unclassified Sphingobium TaxID=2611147 RepID=UPI0035A649A1